MNQTKHFVWLAVVLCGLATTPAAPAEKQTARSPLTLVDLTNPSIAAAAVATDAKLQPGKGTLRVQTGHAVERPGVSFKAPSARWDLTGYEYVETTVANLGKNALTIHCAVDNAKAVRFPRTNCCVESVTIGPGAKANVKVKIRARAPQALREKLPVMRGLPGGFDNRHRDTVDPSNVVAVSLWIYRPSADQAFEVSSIRAGGTAVSTLPANLDSLFPLVDRYGQYIHKDWPGKTHSEKDMAAQREREAADLAAHPGPQGWNQYGGWLAGPKLEATGRFRVAKWGGKWWFVDPEGRLFWSHGLVRVTWSSAYTPITGRLHLFAELPERNSPLGAFYGRSTWPIAGGYERGIETYNFSGANLLRKYGPKWQEVYADLTHRRLRSWGTNTMANCSQPAIYRQHKTPYTATVYRLDNPPSDAPNGTGYVATIHGAGRPIEGTSGGWGKFPDVFDPSFKANLLKEVAAQRGTAVGDPWCLGYFPGNELHWGSDEAALGRATLASPADQPAKRILVDDLKAKYGTIDKLNAAWKSSYASWDAMLASTTPPDVKQGRGDLGAFLEKTADAYFRQCREAVKEIDPQGLYLGCRFAGWSHPAVFRMAAKYSDVISVNRYAPTLTDLTLPEGIDKPVVIGEFHFGALDRGLFHATLCPVADQQARAAAYEKYVRSALENPLVVGTHWHQFGDQSTTGRDDGENFQNGFIDVCDTPYVETIDACRRIGYQMYDVRAGKK